MATATFSNASNRPGAVCWAVGISRRIVKGVNEHALATADGPLPTVGMEGYRDGIVDDGILRDLERAILIRPQTLASPEAAVPTSLVSPRMQNRA